MPPRRVTRGTRATSAEPALLAEPPQNSSVAENAEQHLRMRLSQAQLERERQASARSSARRYRSRGRKLKDVFIVVLVLEFVFVVLNCVIRGEESKKTKKSKISKFPVIIMPVTAAGNGGRYPVNTSMASTRGLEGG